MIYKKYYIKYNVIVLYYILLGEFKMKMNEQTRQIAIGENYFGLWYILEENTEAYVSYGIKIVMTDLKTGSSTVAVVNDITTEIETAEGVFKMITNGIVTPTTLREIVEDLICEVPLHELIGVSST